MSDAEVKFHVIYVDHSGYFSKMEWNHGYGRPMFSETLDGARVYLSDESYRKDLKRVVQHCPLGGPYPIIEVWHAEHIDDIGDDERYQKNKERAAKIKATLDARWNQRWAKDLYEQSERLTKQVEGMKAEAERYDSR